MNLQRIGLPARDSPMWLAGNLDRLAVVPTTEREELLKIWGVVEPADHESAPWQQWAMLNAELDMRAQSLALDAQRPGGARA